jgi:hypothetical protein
VLGRVAGDDIDEDEITAHADGRDCHDIIGRAPSHVTGVLVKRPLRLAGVRQDMPLDDDLGISRHLDVYRFGRAHAQRLTKQRASQLVLVLVDPQLGCHRQHHGRVGADHHRHRQVFASQLSPALVFPQVLAAVQAGSQFAPVLHLQPSIGKVVHPTVRVTRRYHSGRDIRAGIMGKVTRDGQPGKVGLLAYQGHFMHRPVRHALHRDEPVETLAQAGVKGLFVHAQAARHHPPRGKQVSYQLSRIALDMIEEQHRVASLFFQFQRQGDAWAQQARLTAPDSAPFDLFGSALALQGDILAVGARSADLSGKRNAGVVYVYQRQGAEWALQVKLVAKDAGELDYFGQDLALFQDELLVGAPGHDGPSSGDNFGAVYRFQRRGAAWRQAASLSVPDLAPNAQFGYTLALDERAGILAVHAQQSRPNPNPEPGMENSVYRENYLGTVYVFERSGADWRYQARLTPNQRPDVGYYLLPVGRVAAGGSTLSGETIVLSMGFYGSYIFQRQGGQWTQLPPPEITFQAMGMHTMSYILTENQDLLIFGSIGLSEAGAGVLLIDQGVFK